MASLASDPPASAIYEFVQARVYPTDTSVVSQNLSTSTLESLEKLLHQARLDVQASIRELSVLSAPDIDGWVAQAKQLDSDRDASLAEVEKIKHLHAQVDSLRAKEKDSKCHIELLQDELYFNEGLADALVLIRDTTNFVVNAGRLLDDGDLEGAATEIKEAERALEGPKLESLKGTNAVGLLVERVDEQTSRIVESTCQAWDRLLSLEVHGSINIQRQDGRVNIDSVTEVLDCFGLLFSKALAFNKALDENILGKLLGRSSGPDSWTVVIEGDLISLASSTAQRFSLSGLFQQLTALAKFLKTKLPMRVNTEVAKLLAPKIQNYLLLNILPSVIPLNVTGLSMFSKSLEQVNEFVRDANSLGWYDTKRLSTWAECAPQNWLQARSANSLHSLRQILKRGLGNARSVERVETQTTIEDETIKTGKGDADDWNDKWSDEDPEKLGLETPQTSAALVEISIDEDEDVSAWANWDDDGVEREAAESSATTDRGNEEEDDNDDDGVDAWDSWEDDNEEIPVSQNDPPKGTNFKPNGDMKSQKQQIVERTITLRESYHITALPEQVIEAIVMLVEDADLLSSSEDLSNPIIHAAPSLYALPGTLLAMFRSSAPLAYSRSDSGNMYLYNDCLYLAEQLRSFSTHHATRYAANNPLVLNQDIIAVEIFGKRAYLREMESQKTILGDILDGAQSFSNCTEEPYAAQCDLAIASVIDRIRQVHAQWGTVLSPSILLQATGSLLSTICGKIIIDIEDLGDIGEAESQRLTGFCSSISAMEDMFLPESQQVEAQGDSSDNQVPATAVYVPNWLKFQYLSNILESNLADVKYLWAEGGLALEYSAEEVVDLIESLFADSPRRRETIAEIRGE